MAYADSGFVSYGYRRVTIKKVLHLMNRFSVKFLSLFLFSAGLLANIPPHFSSKSNNAAAVISVKAANHQFVDAMDGFLSADKIELAAAAENMVLKAERSLELIELVDCPQRQSLLKEWGSLWGEFLATELRAQKWLDQTRMLGAVVLASNADASVGDVHIYYINGIRGSLLQAVKSKTILEKALEESMPSAIYSLAFNPSNNALVDILQSASQVSLELTASELGPLLSPVGDFFKEVIDKVSDGELRKKLEKFYEKVRKKIKEQRGRLDRLSAKDLEKHIAAYQKDLDAGRKLVLVSHSQGAFYANAAVEKMRVAGSDVDQIGLYAIATPAPSLADGSKTYLTHKDDIIQYVPGALAPNFSLRDKAGKLPKLALDKLHFFSTYMHKSYNARARIVSDITKKMAAI